MKRKYMADVMRAADRYARTKDKNDREMVRAWAKLLYERGRLDGRLEKSPANISGVISKKTKA